MTLSCDRRSSPSGVHTFAAAVRHLRSQGVPSSVLEHVQTVTLGERRFDRGQSGFQALDFADLHARRRAVEVTQARRPKGMRASRSRQGKTA